MIVYHCDRCGRALNVEDRVKPLLIVEDGAKAVDLCPACYGQLERWYRRTARQKVKRIEVPEIVDGFIFK